jgi:ComF family protein
VNASLAASALRNTARGLLELLLPGSCVGCRVDLPSSGLCEACRVKLLELVSRQWCPRCGSSLPPGSPPDRAERGDGCAACLQPLGRFQRVVRLGPYAMPLRQTIRQMKYHRSDSLRTELATMLAHAVEARLPADQRPELVLAIPMHWRRRLTRGCDHSVLLARPIARQLKLPLGHELVRVRNTPPQARLSRSGRLRNVRGAFAVSSPRALEAARILLVDDVTTTGATADEAARALMKAGAATVTLAVLAKADPPRAYARNEV